MAIKKEKNEDNIMNDAHIACLKFIYKGMIEKTKYNFHFK